MEKKCGIYLLLQAGAKLRYVKVGLSTNLNQRMQFYDTNNAEYIQVAFQFMNYEKAIKKENQYKKQLLKYFPLVTGRKEWFIITQQQFDLIKKEKWKGLNKIMSQDKPVIYIDKIRGSRQEYRTVDIQALLTLNNVNPPSTKDIRVAITRSSNPRVQEIVKNRNNIGKQYQFLDGKNHVHYHIPKDITCELLNDTTFLPQIVRKYEYRYSDNNAVKTTVEPIKETTYAPTSKINTIAECQNTTAPISITELNNYIDILNKLGKNEQRYIKISLGW